MVGECRRELRRLVQGVAEAAGCSKRTFRNAASRMRRRIVRLDAAPQLLIGGACFNKGKWPTDHGHPIRSAAGVLKAPTNRLRRD